MRILGISAHYHDSAAALLVDGTIVAAAQEERFTRRKHDASFPIQSARYCLREAGLEPDDLDGIAYYEKPFLKFDRILTESVELAPRGLGRFVDAVPTWLARRLWVRAEIERELDSRVPVFFSLHHESHAASAYGPSPFGEAAVLTIDGVGEWTTNAVWRARGSSLEPLVEIRYPHSLGLLYSAFTAYCGFEVNDGEYKLMGLAPYGAPRHVSTILERLVDLHEDGSYVLAPGYFAYRTSSAMTSAGFADLFGGPPRRPEQPLTSREADLARSIQAVTEEIVLRQARHARALTGARDLCMAGGVALNCCANGRLARERVFDRLWIQPAAGDAGGALGAAYAVWFRLAHPERKPRGRDEQRHSLLGPEYDDEQIRQVLVEAGCEFERLEREELLDETAAALARGEIVGWFQGRMEYGPRALGNRSILADPRSREMQRRVNLAVKFREGFRPFAPVVREAEAREWFDLEGVSPYMLVTAPVRGVSRSPDPAADLAAGFASAQVDSRIPAVTHVDGSARAQTLAPDANPLLHALVDRFEERTGCPVLLNTSFNVSGEPIVCSPRDAYECFCRTGIDRLVMGAYVVRGASRRPAPPKHARAVRSSPGRAALEVFLALLGSVAFRAGGAPRAAAGVLAAGIALAALRILAPGAHARFERAASRFGACMARALAWPSLGLLFLVLVTPFALVARRLRRESGGASSFWCKPQDPSHDPTRPH